MKLKRIWDGREKRWRRRSRRRGKVRVVRTGKGVGEVKVRTGKKTVTTMKDTFMYCTQMKMRQVNKR